MVAMRFITRLTSIPEFMPGRRPNERSTLDDGRSERKGRAAAVAAVEMEASVAAVAAAAEEEVKVGSAAMPPVSASSRF